MSLIWYFAKSYLNFSIFCLKSNVFTCRIMVKKYILGVNVWACALKKQNIYFKIEVNANLRVLNIFQSLHLKYVSKTDLVSWIFERIWEQILSLPKVFILKLLAFFSYKLSYFAMVNV